MRVHDRQLVIDQNFWFFACFWPINRCLSLSASDAKLLHSHSNVHLLFPVHFWPWMAEKTGNLETQINTSSNGKQTISNNELEFSWKLQIQFTVMLIHAICNLRPSCESPKWFIVAFIPNIVLIYKMFYDFYQTSYRKTGQKTQ